MKFPSVYDLKVGFSKVLRPVTTALVNCGVTANMVTIAAIVLSAMQGAAMYLWPSSSWVLLSLPIVLFVRMALNNIDGCIANWHNQKTELGGYLNEIGDVLSDGFLYLPLAKVLTGFSADLVVVVAFFAVIIEFAGVLAHKFHRERAYNCRLFGKSDRALLFGLLGLGLFVDRFYEYNWIQPVHLNWLFAAWIILCILTLRERRLEVLGLKVSVNDEPEARNCDV